MSHHMQVGIPNLPLGTWWRTQSGGNGGHQSCPFNHPLYMYSYVCVCVLICVYEEHREQREKHREKREQRRIERA